MNLVEYEYMDNLCKEKYKDRGEQLKFLEECKAEYEYVVKDFIKSIVEDVFDNRGRNRGTLVKGMVVAMNHPETGKRAIWNVDMVNYSRAKLKEVGGEYTYSVAPTAGVIVLFTPEPEKIVSPPLQQNINNEPSIKRSEHLPFLRTNQIFPSDKPKPIIPDDLGI